MDSCFALSCGHTIDFYPGKLELLTVYLGKLDFLSVTDLSLGILPQGSSGAWICLENNRDSLNPKR